MTLQLFETLKYKKFYYVLCSPRITEKIFDPNDLGIDTSDYNSTHCYKGWSCEFEIKRSVLRLKTLFLLTGNTAENTRRYHEQGLKLFGKFPVYQENIMLIGNAYVFSDLDRIIPYTGKMVIGTEAKNLFTRGDFEIVLKLYLKDGKVFKEKDQSPAALRLREMEDRYYQRKRR